MPHKSNKMPRHEPAPTPSAHHLMIVRKLASLKLRPPFAPNSHEARATEALRYCSAPLLQAIAGDSAPWSSWLARTAVIHHINVLCARTNLDPLQIYKRAPTAQPPPIEPPPTTLSSSDESDSCPRAATQSHHSKYMLITLARAQAAPPYPRPAPEFIDLIRRTIGAEVNRATLKTWLSKQHANSLTQHIPWLLTELGHAPPPKLTPAEHDHTMILFEMALRELLRVRPSSSISYRYLLYKILEGTLCGGARRRAILRQICLPNQRTLSSLDAQYRGALKHIGLQPSITLVEDIFVACEQFDNPAL